MWLTPDEKYEIKGKVLAWCDKHLNVPELDVKASKEMLHFQKSGYSWNGTRSAVVKELFAGNVEQFIEKRFLKSIGVPEVIPYFDALDEETIYDVFDFVADEIEKYIEAKTTMDGHFSVYAGDLGVYLQYSEDVPEYV